MGANADTHLYRVLLRAVWEDLPRIPWLARICGAASALSFLSFLLLLFLARPASGQEMVRVPAGPFLMGSDSGPADERPAHRVDLPSFEIDRLPVTNAQFARFLNAVGLLGPGERGSMTTMIEMPASIAVSHGIEGMGRNP